MPMLQKILSNDYIVKPEISFDGRSMAIVGKTKFYVIDPTTLQIVSEIHIADSHYCKMTDSHVFIKHCKTGDKGWTIASLKDTRLFKCSKGSALNVLEEKGLQYLLVNSREQATIVGVYSQAEPITEQKPAKGNPRKVCDGHLKEPDFYNSRLNKNPSFKLRKVKADMGQYDKLSTCQKILKGS
jgi:hypothetical protein